MKKKFIKVQALRNKGGKQFLRIEIARPRVVKRLLAEYKTHGPGDMGQNGEERENVNKA